MTSSGITILVVFFIAVVAILGTLASVLGSMMKKADKERSNIKLESDALLTILSSDDSGFGMKETITKGGIDGSSAICTIYRKDEVPVTSTSWTDKSLTEAVARRLKQEARLDALRKVVQI